MLSNKDSNYEWMKRKWETLVSYSLFGLSLNIYWMCVCITTQQCRGKNKQICKFLNMCIEVFRQHLCVLSGRGLQT